MMRSLRWNLAVATDIFVMWRTEEVLVSATYPWDKLIINQINSQCEVWYVLECFFCHVLPPTSSCRTRILSKSRVGPMALKISRLSHTYLFLYIRESLLTLVLSTLQCRFPSGGGFPQQSFLGAPSSAAVKISLRITRRYTFFFWQTCPNQGGHAGISLEFEFLIVFVGFFGCSFCRDLLTLFEILR